MTVTQAFAEDAKTPGPQQYVIDDSMIRLLAAPTEGGRIHALDNLALEQPMARSGISSAFVLPVQQDGQPAGVRVLG